MKGIQISIEVMGKLLISIFIISIIVFLLVTYLPEFTDSGCQQKQFEEISSLISEAADKRTSSSIKQFTVFSCVEHVNFDRIACDLSERRQNLGFDGEQRCYEVLFVGEGGSNCDEMESVRILDEKGDTVSEGAEACTGIEGSLRTIPGGYNFLEITCDDCDGPIKYTPGSYAVEVGAFSIKFLEKPN